MWSLAAIVVLLLGVYLLRRQVVLPLVRGPVERALATALSAERVTFGAIDGDWLTGVTVRDLTVAGGTGVLTSLRGGEVSAEFSLVALLGGDLAGLRRLRVQATELDLELPSGSGEAAPKTAASAPFALPDLAPWLAIARDGVAVHVDRLRLHGGTGERPGERIGPLALEVPAGRGDREVHLTYAGLRLAAQVPVDAGSPAAIALDVDDPGSVLDLFDLGIGVQQGALHAALQVVRAPFTAKAQVDLRGLQQGRARLETSHIEASLDERTLQVPTATLDLPGVAVTLRGVSAPSPLAAAAMTLAALRGEFTVRLDDLEAYREQLPTPFALLLPIRGTVAGAVRDGELHLAEGALSSRDFDLSLHEGRVPLQAADWRRATGALGFALTLHGEQQFLSAAVEALGAVRTAGTVTGQLSGSVEAPAITAAIDLGESASALASFAAARGQASLRDGELAVDAVQFTALRLPVVGAAGAAPSDATVTAGVRLGAAGFDLDTLRARLTATSDLPVALLASLGEALPLAAEPNGPTTVELVARHDAAGFAVEQLQIATAPDSPVQVTLAGSGRLPFHLTTDGLVALAVGEATFQLGLTAPGPDGAALPMALQATVRVAADELQFKAVEARAGEARLRGEFGVRPNFGALLRGEPAIEAAVVTVALDLDAVDLARLPSAWWGGLLVEGRVTGHLGARGTLATLEPDVHLAITAGQLALAAPTESSPPILAALAGTIVASRSTVTIGDLQARVAGGPLVLTASIDSGAEPLWQGWRTAKVEIDGDLQGVALASLAALEGTASATFAVKGTLDQPTATLRSAGQLAQWQGVLAWPIELPPLPEGELTWTAAVAADERGIAIEQLAVASGEAPASHLEITASGPLPVSWRAGSGLSAPPATPASAVLPIAIAMALPASDTAPAMGLDLHLELAADGLRVIPSTVQVAGGDVAVHLAATCDWPRLLRGEQPLASVTLRGGITLQHLALGAMPPSWLGLPVLVGEVTGDLDLDGKLEEPIGLAAIARAQLALHGGELKAESLPRVEQLEAALTMDAHTLTLGSLTGLIGAGHFEAHGTLHADERLVTLPPAAVLDLAFTGTDVLLYRGDGARLRASPQLDVKGSLQDLQVTGELLVGRGSKYVRRISLLPDLASRGGVAVSSGLHLFELPPPFGEHVRFDVALRTSEAFEVRTNVFDGKLALAAHLRGLGSEPRLEGTVSMQSGTLRFPGANLAVTSGVLTFAAANPFYPELLVRAEGKRMGIQITATVSGRYDRPEVLLASVPPLPPQDLITLLTTGQLTSTLTERGVTGQARFVGGYLAQEVIEAWFGSDSTERGESIFDRLTIESGREVSKNGVESVMAELSLGNRVSVQAERDQYEDYNMGIVLRFKF